MYGKFLQPKSVLLSNVMIFPVTPSDADERVVNYIRESVEE